MAVDALSWVDQYFDGFGEPQPSISERYVAAFYWALVTMSTIGYGDVTPTTTAERCFGVVAMFAGTSIFAYVVGSVRALVLRCAGPPVSITTAVQPTLDVARLAAAAKMTRTQTAPFT